MNERRRNPRHPCQSRIGVIYPDGRAELLWAHDISDRGISLHIDRPLPIGMPLRIALFVFSAATGKQVQIYALARVCYCVLDQGQADFRVGLAIVEFIDDGESLFNAEINRINTPLQKSMSTFAGTRIARESYPLRRRIKLALDNGELLPGWTEEVNTHGMRVNLAMKLPSEAVLPLNFPVMLPSDNEVYAVRAKARVVAVTFRPMGNFATNLHVFDYENDGESLLREELSQRFPSALDSHHEKTHKQPTVPTASTTDEPKTPTQPADEDAEALPTLAASRKPTRQ